MDLNVVNSYNDEFFINKENPWHIVVEGFNPNIEREVETILAIGNGYIGTRNSLEEYYRISNPATFLAGFYEKISEEGYNELVKLPDWMRIQIFVEGEIINLFGEGVLEHRRCLDLKNGLSIREFISIDSMGRITNIRITKFVSLSQKNTACKSVILMPENYSGKIKVQSGIDGRLTNNTYPIPETTYSKEFLTFAVKAKNSDKIAAMVQRSEFIYENKAYLTPFEMEGIKYNQEYQEEMTFEELEWDAKIDTVYQINCLTSIYSENDTRDPIDSARTRVSELGNEFYRKCLETHTKEWQKFWNNSEIKISGNEKDQKLINFAIYHLITSGRFAGNDNSIPARNLTGESYKGHIFWDTEIYLLPFFIFTAPDIARNLLMYRYHTLPGARENAKREGFEGASYAWESTDSGLEMTPPFAYLPDGQVINIYSGKYENHITPDIAYALWQYWIATNDEDFIINYGAEILFETARFCRGLFIKDSKYHTYKTVGPDEYHELVDDNTYTNIMAGFNLEIAVKTAEFLKANYNEKFEELKKKINLQDQEIESWKEVKDNIYTGYNPDTKLFEQFKGYFNLEYVDLKQFEPRHVPVDIILGRDRIIKTQIIKQPDVIMFLFLFANRFSQDIIESNFDYYLKRDSHGSSLSPSICGIVAARLGKLDLAYEHFIHTATVDLNDNMGNASGGIHIASLGGTWMSAIMGFAGMYVYEQGLLFNPNLPNEWNKLEFSLFWRNQKLELSTDKDNFKIKVSGTQNIQISIGFDNWKELKPGETYYAKKNQNWYWK